MFRKIVKSTERISAENIKNTLHSPDDLEVREIRLGGGNLTVSAVYIDGLCSGSVISEEIIRPMTSDSRFSGVLNDRAAIELMEKGGIYSATMRKRSDLDDVISDLLNGYCAVVFDSAGEAVCFEVKTSEKRSVSEPKEEKVMKGARDAFVEVLRTNTSLVRRRMKNPDLCIKQVIIGEKTNTSAAIVYIEGFTNANIVSEAERRLSAIKCEGVLSSAVLEENIADSPKSPFPQIINTERPDKFCINILEGRVGILIDGLPIGYLVPGTFTQFLKVPEDHADHYLIASTLTFLRYFCLILSLILPSFYVSIVMYHQEMIPIKLMQSIIDAKMSVPFPTAFEVLAMLIAFELLQEAGLRLPDPVGQTVSIIGALIVGQSAVEAKVVSPVVVVVIALAGISGYTIPNQDMAAAVRIFRFLLVLLSITFGMFGLAIGMALIIWSLAGLDSFGVPYLTPFAGSEGRHLFRALFRFPMKKKRDREPELKRG